MASHPLDLSILLSGGNEKNTDTLSSSERRVLKTSFIPFQRKMNPGGVFPLRSLAGKPRETKIGESPKPGN